MKMTKVDSDIVHNALKSKEWMIIDTRDSNSFIGWCMEGERKKGHINGATDFAASWISFPFISAWSTKEKRVRYVDDKFDEKKINPEKKIILYDTNGKDAQVVREYFLKKGITDLYYFNFNDWDGETKWAENYDRMVPVEWVKNLIDGKERRFYDGGNYRIFEVSETKEPGRDFKDGHIPGSTHIWVNEFQKFPEQCTANADVLEKFACENGITADTTVVIYAMGYTGAAHILATVLEYMGVKNIHCINGSSNQWIHAGFPLERGRGSKEKVNSFGASIPKKSSLIVGINEVKEILRGSASGQLVDIRTWREYTGETSGYKYVERSGRIPNTLWCAKDHWYLNPDETMGNPEEMVRHWQSCGIDINRKSIFFCGAGGW